ncbi:tetratricopeptide repeat protein [Psychrobacter urativorans]|nr:tetratricopeptide repeat protein [Psychrobacter urativorans]
MQLSKTMFISSMIIGTLSLTACETVPIAAMSTTTTSTNSIKTSVTQVPVTKVIVSSENMSPKNVVSKNATSEYMITEDDYVDEDEAQHYPLEPYIIPKLPTSSDRITQQAPAVPSHHDEKIQQPVPPSYQDLLERARQKSQQPTHATTSNNSSLPAFQKLMQTGMSQLQAGDLTAAESSFTRAQRLVPQSSAVYFYLAQVALKKNQPHKAEAMARRGLSFSTDTNQRRALWQLVLRSGQLQNNARVIKEAQQALR